MKLDQYIIVNLFGIYAKRHGIKDLGKASQDLNIVYKFSQDLMKIARKSPDFNPGMDRADL